jgi:hypothetical protein
VTTAERFSRSGCQSTRPARKEREAGGGDIGALLKAGEAAAAAEELDAVGGRCAGARAGCYDSSAEETSTAAEGRGAAEESPTAAGEGVRGGTDAVAGGAIAVVRDRTADGGST